MAYGTIRVGLPSSLRLQGLRVCECTGAVWWWLQFDYVFSENGLMAFKDGALLAEQVCSGGTLIPMRDAV